MASHFIGTQTTRLINHELVQGREMDAELGWKFEKRINDKNTYVNDIQYMKNFVKTNNKKKHIKLKPKNAWFLKRKFRAEDTTIKLFKKIYENLSWTENEVEKWEK